MNAKLNVKKGIPYAVLLLIFLLLPIFLHTSYWIGVLIMVLYKVVGSVSLRTISLSGTLTFAHGTFIALGAYCAGILAKSLGLPPVVTILAGRSVCRLVSVITGLPFDAAQGHVLLHGLHVSGGDPGLRHQGDEDHRRLPRPHAHPQAAPE